MQLPYDDLSEHCKTLAHPYWATTTLAALLVVGILVSYVPQHAKIIQNRSSEGLSPYWILLGGLSSVAAIGNIFTLPSSREDMLCCRELNDGACGAALLGVLQIAVQWTCFMLVVMLYLIFSPATTAEDLSSSTASLTNTNPAKRRDPIIVGITIFVSVFVVAVVSVALVFKYPEYTLAWADILGTIAGVLAAVHHLPQIWHTWRMKDLKSLSVLTLLIQAPGAFVFAFSLALRVGIEGWSTWLVYIVTGLLQFVLLGLAFYFKSNDLKQQREADHQESNSAHDVFTSGVVNRRVSSTNIRQQRVSNRAGDPDERTSLLPPGGDRQPN